MSDLHKHPWVMRRVNQALDAIRDSESEGRETELDLLAFAEDVLDYVNGDVWLASKRASALAGKIERSEVHLRAALDIGNDDPDPGLEAMAVALRRRIRDDYVLRQHKEAT